MTKRPDDGTPEPPGGRAAQRLQMFEEARAPKGGSKPDVPTGKQKPVAGPKPTARRKKR
jgi:hypothetical protein